MIKSQRQGRDQREAWKEVELEEHLACGCGCEPGAAESCVTQSMFNPATCECECTELIWGPERETCLERSGKRGLVDGDTLMWPTNFIHSLGPIRPPTITGYYWDERTCSCRNRHKVSFVLCSRYPYHVPLTILNIATRLHQYSQNISLLFIFTFSSQYVGDNCKIGKPGDPINC